MYVTWIVKRLDGKLVIACDVLIADWRADGILNLVENYDITESKIIRSLTDIQLRILAKT
jgi:hypothetical protein